ncbi:phosphate ABC transporter permease PstA [Collinsella vaginalis]|uniref:phosphate ABC transporter permease PstA n=1 Tax=Collinsella vaginalis TaxID=1870987 RepID=UPI001FE50E5B|nr:phosphate ABC transporter permease PstA [Collinsella vaginalis]
MAETTETPAVGGPDIDPSITSASPSVVDPRADAAERERLRRRAVNQDKFATGVLTAIIGLVLLIVVAMVAYILIEGAYTLVQPGFLTERSRANGTAGGVAYQLFDSFYLLFLTLIISVPISLGGAIFMVEYAPNGPVKRIASTAVETLSSLPSIVVGMFGFLVFSVGFGWKYSIISGAVALTMFNIPILVRAIQQALEDVPQAQRDACLAMGLTRWEATVHVLVPSAMSAIVTGVVLSAGRVFGEAAALLFTSGMSSPVSLNFLSFGFTSPSSAWNIFRPGESLAVHIYKIYGEGSPEAQQIVWGTAALLMICVLIFNVVARLAGRALSRKVTGV